MRSGRTQLDAHGKHQLVIKRGGLHGPLRAAGRPLKEFKPLSQLHQALCPHVVVRSPGRSRRHEGSKVTVAQFSCTLTTNLRHAG